jgi:hypothetical protein
VSGEPRGENQSIELRRSLHDRQCVRRHVEQPAPDLGHPSMGEGRQRLDTAGQCRDNVVRRWEDRIAAVSEFFEPVRPRPATAGQPAKSAPAVPSTCRMRGGRGTVWTTATRETSIGKSNPNGAQSRAV